MATNDNEVKYTDWGAYGDIPFRGRVTPSSVDDTRNYRLSAQQLINGYPAHQFQGEDERQLSIEISLHNRYVDLSVAAQKINEMAASGSPRTLMIGRTIYGSFVIKSCRKRITETKPDGTVVEMSWSLSLVEVR